MVHVLVERLVAKDPRLRKRELASCVWMIGDTARLCFQGCTPTQAVLVAPTHTRARTRCPFDLGLLDSVTPCFRRPCTASCTYLLSSTLALCEVVGGDPALVHPVVDYWRAVHGQVRGHCTGLFALVCRPPPPPLNVVQCSSPFLVSLPLEPRCASRIWHVTKL